MDHVGRNVNLILIVRKITLVLVTELANKLVIHIKKPVHPVNTVILIMKFVTIFANLIKNVPEVMLATNPSVIKTALYLMIVEMTRFVKSNLLTYSYTIIFSNFVVKTKNNLFPFRSYRLCFKKCKKSSDCPVKDIRKPQVCLPDGSCQPR